MCSCFHRVFIVFSSCFQPKSQHSPLPRSTFEIFRSWGQIHVSVYIYIYMHIHYTCVYVYVYILYLKLELCAFCAVLTPRGLAASLHCAGPRSRQPPAARRVRAMAGPHPSPASCPTWTGFGSSTGPPALAGAVCRDVREAQAQTSVMSVVVRKLGCFGGCWQGKHAQRRLWSTPACLWQTGRPPYDSETHT